MKLQNEIMRYLIIEGFGDARVLRSLTPSRRKPKSKTGEEESLVITLCAEGYPDTPKVNDIIHGLDKEYEGVHVFHGGTVHDGNRTKVAGGRVLHLASTAETIAIAHTNIEQAIGEHAIHFAGMQRIKELKAAA